MSTKLTLDVSMKGLAFQESRVSHWEIRLKTVWKPCLSQGPQWFKINKTFLRKGWAKSRLPYPGPSPPPDVILPVSCGIPRRALSQVLCRDTLQSFIYNLLVFAWFMKGFGTHAQVWLCFLKQMWSLEVTPVVYVWPWLPPLRQGLCCPPCPQVSDSSRAPRLQCHPCGNPHGCLLRQGRLFLVADIPYICNVYDLVSCAWSSECLWRVEGMKGMKGWWLRSTRL